ncbi:TatD family hydrolase [Lutimonas zeaxanthinifaciens]|uniref:TatD family hydrolase n=1 Tax=Lutimonas zeaxanthinifaciens TaxID=3060215 RepID=UPI00265CDD2F|nr:TatD family hydrolase [Lutimonas sp. YSD2104]WKK66901.1 TatD family hydrolase [Lutimonas sp. YSD2104]
MMITDTHTHLYVEQFDDDRTEVIEKAISMGIKRFFIPAIDASYYSRMYELEQSFPENIFLMAGLHPTHVKKDYLRELSEVEKQLDNHKFYAIGEIGIDLYWDRTHLKEQVEAFQIQISWAKKRNLPIVIHCREAFDEIFDVLDQVNDENLTGIFHCFTGNREQAEKVLSYGFKMGIGGVVTFRNGGLDKFIGEIPLEHIVLETDSPYLAPTPFRGKRNESSYLMNILDKLADIYGCSTEKIAQITTHNSKEIFGV